MCHQCGNINMNINKCRIDGAVKWEPFWRAKPLKNGVPSGGVKPLKDWVAVWQGKALRGLPPA